MNYSEKYEMTVGLETHIELKTQSKIFCGCSTKFGDAPNTNICPVCTGMPGTLPTLNRAALDYAILAGLATNCKIASLTKFDRKNYFYPDLPKAYQISQYDMPLCTDGYIDVETDGEISRIGIERIHLEEDAGKLVHEKDCTGIDYNRCGVPLIEVVSRPDIKSAEQARGYLQKLRCIMLYLGISDCKMNEGSLRCDVNISVRKKGSTALGERCEIKNMNSFSFIVKAIQYEFDRQCELYERGGTVLPETRRYDQATGRTELMRTKEQANDYRYFPEPDIPPLEISIEHVSRLKEGLPILPDERKSSYIALGIKSSSAEMIASSKYISDYFQAVIERCSDCEGVANLLTGEVFRMLQGDDDEIRLSPDQLICIAQMANEGIINRSTEKKLVSLLWGTDTDPRKYVTDNSLVQINDIDTLKGICEKAIMQSQKAVSDLRGGKLTAYKAILGKAMGLSHGNANPVLLDQCMKDLLGTDDI